MSIMIVGADHLGSIADNLQSLGYDEIFHIKGRKTTDIKVKLNKEIKLILVLTDYINHNLARKIKERAKEYAVPVVYSKRSWSNIHANLQNVL